MKDKLKVILLCIPLYPIYLIGEWYHTNTVLVGRKFSFKKKTKEYWVDIYSTLKG